MYQSPNTKKVVVTGAAGYIGGITCIELKKQGYYVIGIDRRYREHLVEYYDDFYHGDFTDFESFKKLKQHNPCAIIHCAGTSLVGPSLTNPAEYFTNNVTKTNTLLSFLSAELPNIKFIFSSSAAVYGEKAGVEFFKESFNTTPISPYGESKLMIEKMLGWYKQAHGLRYVAFRYFNAAGADASGAHGQEPNDTHIISKIFDAALNDKEFTLYGANYPTKDGTCIRDYVHVTDIALAHILAIDNRVDGVYNLGSSSGYSNLEILQAVTDALSKKIVTIVEVNRQGDHARLIANSSNFTSSAEWIPQYDLNDIITDCITWYNSDKYNKLENKQRTQTFTPL
jgi:UDP-glucose 4-epimerase